MKYLLISIICTIFIYSIVLVKILWTRRCKSNNIELNKESLPSSITSINKIGATLEDKNS